jgi:predicted nucleic acid-binding protein
LRHNERDLVDYSILCTFAALGRLSLLGQLFKRVVITASTRKVFLEELEILKATPESLGTAAYLDGRLVFIPADPAEPNRKRQLLADVIEFFGDPSVEDGAPSAPVWAANRYPVEEQLRFSGGVEVAVLTAKTLSIPLACDEQIVRQVFCKRCEVSSFCTQAILKRALQLGFLSDTEHAKALELLVSKNYTFVSVSGDFLRRHLKENRYKATPIAWRLVRELGATKFPTYPGILELGRVTAELWLHRNDAGAWAIEDWLPVIQEQLRKASIADIYYFPVGIAIELPLFPSVVRSCLDVVVDDSKLDENHRSLLKFSLQSVGRACATHPHFGNAINHAWSAYYPR